MRVVGEEELVRSLSRLAITEPRIVASGNVATPCALLDAAELALERYRLFMLAAHGPLPERPEVIFETPFVGPGMRGAPQAPLLQTWIRYALTSGQKYGAALDFAAVPKTVRKAAERTVATL
jgi:hypothetical protein